MKCPKCEVKYKTATQYRNHLRSVRSVKGRNVCSGMPEHPNFKRKRETNNFLATYAAPSGKAGYFRV